MTRFLAQLSNSCILDKSDKFAPDRWVGLISLAIWSAIVAAAVVTAAAAAAYPLSRKLFAARQLCSIGFLI